MAEPRKSWIEDTKTINCFGIVWEGPHVISIIIDTSDSTMAASAPVPTSPSKLSPNERLIRKRAAARLRQQRCRARKRQAMIENRRQLDMVQSPPQSNQDSGTHGATTRPRDQPPSSLPSHVPCITPPRYIPARSGEGDYWSDSSSSSGPIQSCVSFGSQGSFEDSQRSFERVHKSLGHHLNGSKVHHRPPVVSPSAPPAKPPLDIVRLAEGNSAEPLVAEEEAAVAAMLSLKTGPSKKAHQPVVYKRDIQFQRSEIVPRVAKYRYCNSWEPRHGERFEYGRPPRPIRVVEYHPIPPPPPPPMGAIYRYYPSFEPRHERYNYD